jgi:hypothetical protein
VPLGGGSVCPQKWTYLREGHPPDQDPGINRAASSNGRALMAQECTRCDTILDAHIKLDEEAKKIHKAKGGRPSKTRTAEGRGFPTLKEQGLTKLIAYSAAISGSAMIIGGCSVRPTHVKSPLFTGLLCDHSQPVHKSANSTGSAGQQPDLFGWPRALLGIAQFDIHLAGSTKLSRPGAPFGGTNCLKEVLPRPPTPGRPGPDVNRP